MKRDLRIRFRILTITSLKDKAHNVVNVHPPFSFKYPLVATIYRLEHFPQNPGHKKSLPLLPFFRSMITPPGYHCGMKQNLWVLLNSALLLGNMGLCLTTYIIFGQGTSMLARKRVTMLKKILSRKG